MADTDELLATTKALLQEYKNFGDVVIEVARTSRTTAEVVRDIHVLVNSEKTAALERELRSTRRELVLLKELGRPASVIAAAEKSIAEMETTLGERAEAQRRLDEGRT